MDGRERSALLEAERIVIVASLGPRGWPHSVPMWFVVRDGRVWIWTFAKSQKVRNLRRDPRATLLVEAGREYEELRGVMIEARAQIVREPEAVLAVGREIAARYGGGEPDAGALRALEAQARKRVAVRFEPVETASWDHRKL